MKRVKKVLLAAATVLMLLALTVVLSSAATSGSCGNNLTWSYDSSTKTLTISGTGKMYNYNGSAPWEGMSFKKAVIGNGVTSIGDWAFFRCSYLTSITIPDSVTSIGDYAFEYCSSLTRITIPDSVTSIGDGAFRGCSALTSITIPDSVTSIGDEAFEGCSSLTSITIPDSVTSIGNWAFEGCSSLTSITIPDSVTSIGNYAFWGCSSLTSITIPDSVTSIKNYAFHLCSALTSITIPDSVTSIGNYAFDGCSSLTSITIPDSVTSIGDYAFRGCSSLYDVYYYGNANKWKSISIGYSNTCLTSAYRHYIFTGSISSTNNVSSSQNVTLKYSSFKNVTGYYFGTSRPTVSSSFKTVQEAKTGEIKTNISNSGTYYFTIKTSDGVIQDAYTATFYKTTLNANGGTVLPSSVLTQKGKSFTLPSASRSGYTYSGWAKSKTATSGVKTLTPTANTTYYAVWSHTHTYKTSVSVKATLKSDGKKVSKCTLCGKVKSTTVIPKIASVKLSKAAFTYDGKAKTPTVTVKDSKGNVLKKDTDYTVKYSSGRKNPGTYKVTVTFKGKYSGTKTLSFKIKVGKVENIREIKASGYKKAVSWNAVKGATGYEVYRYDSKQGKWVYAATAKSTSTGFKKLSGTQKYRVRAVMVKDSKTYCGEFSSVITLKA